MGRGKLPLVAFWTPFPRREAPLWGGAALRGLWIPGGLSVRPSVPPHLPARHLQTGLGLTVLPCTARSLRTGAARSRVSAQKTQISLVGKAEVPAGQGGCPRPALL